LEKVLMRDLQLADTLNHAIDAMEVVLLFVQRLEFVLER
jgi:hypothetical protein